MRAQWGSMLYGSAALFTIPIFTIGTLLVVGSNFGWLPAVLYVLSFPLLIVFCWFYSVSAINMFKGMRCWTNFWDKPVIYKSLRHAIAGRRLLLFLAGEVCSPCRGLCFEK